MKIRTLYLMLLGLYICMASSVFLLFDEKKLFELGTILFVIGMFCIIRLHEYRFPMFGKNNQIWLDTRVQNRKMEFMFIVGLLSLIFFCGSFDKNLYTDLRYLFVILFVFVVFGITSLYILSDKRYYIQNTDDEGTLQSMIQSDVQKKPEKRALRPSLYPLILERLLILNSTKHQKFLHDNFSHMPSLVWELWKEHRWRASSPQVCAVFLADIVHEYYLLNNDRGQYAFSIDPKEIDNECVALSEWIANGLYHNNQAMVLEVMRQVILQENGKGNISNFFIHMDSLYKVEFYRDLKEWVELCAQRHDFYPGLNSAIYFGDHKKVMFICMKNRVDSSALPQILRETFKHINGMFEIREKKILFNQDANKSETTDFYTSLSVYWDQLHELHYSTAELERCYELLLDTMISKKPIVGWHSYVFKCMGPATTAKGLREIFEQKTRNLEKSTAA